MTPTNDGADRMFIAHMGEYTLKCEPMVSQPYSNCIIDAGMVEGHPVDTIYLRFQREAEEPTIFFLRKDEALAIIWVLSGTLWSDSMEWVVK